MLSKILYFCQRQLKKTSRTFQKESLDLDIYILETKVKRLVMVNSIICKLLELVRDYTTKKLKKMTMDRVYPPLKKYELEELKVGNKVQIIPNWRVNEILPNGDYRCSCYYQNTQHDRVFSKTEIEYIGFIP